jgi:hypothetical protein
MEIPLQWEIGLLGLVVAVVQVGVVIILLSLWAAVKRRRRLGFASEGVSPPSWDANERKLTATHEGLCELGQPLLGVHRGIGMGYTEEGGDDHHAKQRGTPVLGWAKVMSQGVISAVRAVLMRLGRRVFVRWSATSKAGDNDVEFGFGGGEDGAGDGMIGWGHRKRREPWDSARGAAGVVGWLERYSGPGYGAGKCLMRRVGSLRKSEGMECPV